MALLGVLFLATRPPSTFSFFAVGVPLVLAFFLQDVVGAGLSGSSESTSALRILACSLIILKRPSMLLYVVPVEDQ